MTNIKFLAKGGFSTVYKAIWLDGRIKYWDYDNQQWERRIYEYVNSDNNSDADFSNIKGYEIAIKSLDNSSNINDEFLNEVRYL